MRTLRHDGLEDARKTQGPEPRVALMVCDGSTTLKDTVDTLRLHGFIAVLATSVRQAVRLLPRLKPHILIATAPLTNYGWLRRQAAETDTPLVLVGGTDEFGSEPNSDALEVQILEPARREEIAITAEALVASDGHRAEVLGSGALLVYPDRCIASINGRNVEVPPREFALLLQLTLHRPAPLTPTTLAALAWPDNPFATSADVYRHVYELRKLLGDHGRQPPLIRARRGVGYQLESDLQEIEPS